jgi:hypothetical protein
VGKTADWTPGWKQTRDSPPFCNSAIGVSIWYPAPKVIVKFGRMCH